MPNPEDGTRILVDRLWPRGLRKERAQIDVWLKEIAPSTELRKWFNHDEGRFEAFKVLYEKELQEEPWHRDAVSHLMGYVDNGPVTLVYGSKNPTINHAVVLRQFIVDMHRRID